MQMQKSLHNNVQFSYKHYSFYGYNSIMITPSFQLLLKTMIFKTNQTVFRGQINYGKNRNDKDNNVKFLVSSSSISSFLFLIGL